MTKNEFYFVKMGKDAQTVLNEYYGESLVKFIADDPLADGESSGEMYMGKIKTYYDKYGYDAFNKALIGLYEEEKRAKKESKDNE